MCGTASGWSKCAIIVMTIGVAIHIAGWATMNWMTYETSNSVIETDIGLWRMKSCTSGSCSESSVASTYETDEFNAVRAFETIVFCGSVFTCILLLIYVLAEAARRQPVAAVIMILCYVIGTCSFVGMIIHVVAVPDPFVVSWSMGLTVIAMVLFLITGTLMIPDTFDPYYYDRSDLVTPMEPPPYRGATPNAYRGGVQGSRWRSY